VGALERASRWARRHPAAAALVAVSVLAALALVGATVAWAFTVRLNAAKDRAEQAERDALEQGEKAEAARQAEAVQRLEAEKYRGEAEEQRQLAQRYLYASDMSLAHAAWHENQIGRMQHLLERHQSGPQAERDLRGFEWYYLWHLCHSDLLTIRMPNPVWTVAYSPDGTRLASFIGDGTVRIWDAQTGQETLPSRKNLLSRGGGVPSPVWSSAPTASGWLPVWAGTTIKRNSGERCMRCRDFCGHSDCLNEQQTLKLAEAQEETYTHWVATLVPLLKETGFRLEPLAESKVEDRPAVGIKVEDDPLPPVSLLKPSDNGHARYVIEKKLDRKDFKALKRRWKAD
jgi:hypothetical protein